MPRPAVLILCLLVGPASAIAQEFKEAMAALKEVRKSAFNPGAHARVNPVVERVVALRDARTLKPLAEFLLQTLAAEDVLFERAKKIQKAGADANQRVREIDEELKHLDIRLRAGALDVAAQIDELRGERTTNLRTFEQVREQSDRLDRSIGNARDQRERLSKACVSVIRATDKNQRVAALSSMRPVFDISKANETLLFVRVLRGSGVVEAAPHLVDVVTHPTLASAPRRNAVSALAALRTPKGTATLIQLWERDPKGQGKDVQHALSLAAKRYLADLKSAREWAATLK